MKCNVKRSLKCIWNYFLDFIILYHWSIFPSSLSLQALLQVSLRVQEPFFTLYLFLNEEKCIKLCQKCHYVSIHCYHIDLHNSCHKWDIVTFGTYLKSRACQTLLSNKKSMLKAHPYKTWQLIKYCHVRDILEWICPITIIYVYFHTLWIQWWINEYISIHMLWYISMYVA